MPKFNEKAFRSWIKESMLLVIPAKMFAQKFLTTESEEVFYAMVCHHACLRPEDKGVKAAYHELRNPMAYQTKRA